MNKNKVIAISRDEWRKKAVERANRLRQNRKDIRRAKEKISKLEAENSELKKQKTESENEVFFCKN